MTAATLAPEVKASQTETAENRTEIKPAESKVQKELESAGIDIAPAPKRAHGLIQGGGGKNPPRSEFWNN